jgi:trigger factor
MKEETRPLLNVITEPLENCEVLMTVEVDEEETDKLLKAAAQRISKQARLPGFRPGKAPYAMIIRRFGEDTVHEETMSDLSQSVFKRALEQAKLEPYAPASMEEVTWTPLVMKVRVPVAPIVELGDYRTLRVEAEPVEASEEEIEAELKRLQEEYAKVTPVEFPAQLGNLVTMDREQRAGDELLDHDEDFEYELVEVEDDSQPDLTTPLIGVAAGDEKEFTVTYPETYRDARYAGKEITVAVKIHGVKNKEIFPLDDDFAQMVGDFDTLQQLKDNLAGEIRQRKQRAADGRLADKALKQLAASVKVEWPKELEEKEIDQVLARQERELRRSGLSMDTYLSIQKKTREELREEVRPKTREQLRESLVLSKLVELENLSIAGHEVVGQIDRLSAMAGEQQAELRQALTTPDNVQYIMTDLLTAKVMERLAQIAKGEAEASDQPSAVSDEPSAVSDEPSAVSDQETEARSQESDIALLNSDS